MQRYDVIIIGTGAGGGTLAYRLASSGKRILLLERGPYLPQEEANWDAREVLQEERYRTTEKWYGPRGQPMRPGVHYYVGGNTKMYGAALVRFRKEDFQEVVHQGGVSPAWPLDYHDFAPYYIRAERLYDVHAQRGEDPTEPECVEPYPFPSVRHEERIQEIHDALESRGLHPFHLPLGLKLDEQQPDRSLCIRCGTCDGFPCRLHAKADAEVNAVRPALTHSNVTLMTGARALRLQTNPAGSEITGVEVEVEGSRELFSADVTIVACGAVNSAVLLLNSTHDRHPRGLGNGSGLVGRHFMVHNTGVIVAVTPRFNPTVFQKTLGIQDFYRGDRDHPYPLGAVQLLGKLTKERMAANGAPLVPQKLLGLIASHAVAWWIMSEDLPDPNNRVVLQRGEIHLRYRPNNMESYRYLMKRWARVLRSIDRTSRAMPLSVCFPHHVSLREVAHQCGTCRFGPDPKTSVLDLNCRVHEIDNLYVVDSSFFPSSAALNPSLTIMANALRVGDHLCERFRSPVSEI